MNLENINKLINHLERLVEVGNTKTFDLGTWLQFGKDLYESVPPDQERAQTLLAKMEGRDELKKFDCETVACIAGHAAIIASSEGQQIFDVEDDAQDWLGLDDCQAVNLFIPNFTNPGSFYARVKIEDAIFALKALRDDGEVKWPERLGYSPRPF